MGHRVEAAALVPDKNAQFRYDMILFSPYPLILDKAWLLRERSISVLRIKFEKNQGDSIYFRATGAFWLLALKCEMCERHAAPCGRDSLL
mgnify:CR=1 FL=1